MNFNEKTFKALDEKNHCFYILNSSIESNSSVHLTTNETLLLNLLFKHKGDFVENLAIEHFIWDNDSMSHNCSGRLKTLVYELRKKIGKETIKNCHGLGYRVVLG